MILRRIASAFRRQDWFTVLVETMIVVMGVFLGLQVNNWNAAQTDKRLEKQYLQRLYDEVALSIKDNEAGLAWDEERARTQRLVLNALESGQLSDDQRADFDAGLIYFGYQNTITMRWATAEELRSTGKMAVIRDVELRDRLAQAEASFLYRSAQTDSLTERIRSYREHVDRKFAPMEYDHRLNGPVTLAYDFDALAGDGEVYNMLAQIEFYASLVRRNMASHIDRLNALKDSLGEALGDEIKEPQ